MFYTDEERENIAKAIQELKNAVRSEWRGLVNIYLLITLMIYFLYLMFGDVI